MKKISFNENWTYRKLGEENRMEITLPHDAMICEERNANSPSGINAGWIVGCDYAYEKTFVRPEEKTAILEFEGVYHNAEVYLNGVKIAFRPYGYTNFYVDLSNKLKDGENKLKVVAHNSDQPNSRWYSGAGIYRPVWLYLSDGEHICINGLKIKTLGICPAKVQIDVATSGKGEVELEIFDGEKSVWSGKQATDGKTTFAVSMKDAKLWSVENPRLYTAKATFGNDVVEQSFGIRTVSCDAEKGFCINGERVILLGACIHADNGLLGAISIEEAEDRKVRLLKKAGYNAIRSAHNPCSKALLDACDRQGMLVMDEYADMWYVHKCQYDYATYLLDWWKQDLLDLVDKDFNHPSVVMYSTGNEVGETSEARGIELTKQFTEYLHSLDDTRFVSCGINIWFNAMYHMGFGQYSDEKAKKQAQASNKSKKKKAVGSEFFNNLAGLVGAGFMKTMATLPICDRVTKKAYANMDVAGYNYGVKRYKHDLKKHPDRIILGSETFCSDARKFYQLAQSNVRLIGDFVWAGIDYLGEVGIGSWEYHDYAPESNLSLGWVSAGSGRLDLVGNELGEALYTKVAFEEIAGPKIAVVPVGYARQKHSPSAWKCTNAIASWSWDGAQDDLAKVEVYGVGHKVELWLNGNKIGTKRCAKNGRTHFKCKYRSGEIKAVLFDKFGNELGTDVLRTAGEKTVLSLTPEKTDYCPNGVVYVDIAFTDEKGEVKPLERGNVSVTVDGGKLLALGSACPYNPNGFDKDTTDTYYGRALAIIKVDGKATVKATSGKLSAKTEISAN